MARWQREVDEVGEAARSLVAATSIDEALRREVRVAAACASCHLGAQKPPVFAEPTSVAIDDGGQRARMARHQWAADRLWEGLVGAADHPWHMRLDVLAKTPLPYSTFTDAPLLATSCSRSRGKRSRASGPTRSRIARAGTERCS
jgi:hypothetical protein